MLRLKVGGVADHVHILCGLSRKISLSELVKNLKTSSSKILKGKVHDGFSWQNGYGAFSVNQSARKSVFSYIADQEIHHRRMTFQEEFRALLNMSGMCGIDPGKSYAPSGRTAKLKFPGLKPWAESCSLSGAIECP